MHNVHVISILRPGRRMDMDVGAAEPVIALEVVSSAPRRSPLENLRPWQKGQPSPNPRGRPKKDYDLAAMARQHAEKAVATLAKCLSDPSASWPAKVSAATELLDRGFGKAPQSLDVEHQVTLSDAFEEFIGKLNSQQHEAPMIDGRAIEAAA